MDRGEIAKGCVEQAGWAAKLASPMYEALLRRMAEDVRSGGPCVGTIFLFSECPTRSLSQNAAAAI
jgi:hypothetical protein